MIVQALEPHARPLRHAAEHDAEGFTAGELERRRALRYPPFGNLIRVVCSSPEPGPEQAAAEAVRERIDLSDGDGARPGAAVSPAGTRALAARGQVSRARAGHLRRAPRGRGGLVRPGPLRGEFRGRRRPAIIWSHGRRALRPRGDRRGGAPPRPRGRGAPGGRDVPRAPARRPGAEEPRHHGRPLRRGTARAGRPDGRDHVRRPGRGPGGAAAGDLPARAGLPRRPRRSRGRPGQPRARVARARRRRRSRRAASRSRASGWTSTAPFTSVSAPATRRARSGWSRPRAWRRA